MIKVENIDVYNFEGAIRGMRNPLNSWDKSDSHWCEDLPCGYIPDERPKCQGFGGYCIGNKDLSLMQKLVKGGPDHSKFMRQIFVSMDITGPLYWWKEFDTYKVGTVANSCSTMHKIHEKEFTLEDFSHEHLLKADNCKDEEIINVSGIPYTSRGFFLHIINALNFFRTLYLNTKDKKYWWQMIQFLPSSYNQKRTVTLNYQILRNMYFSRKNHKLDEWREFCNIIEELPCAKKLICYKGE